MMDFNKILENGKKLDLFEQSKKQVEAGMDFDLTGKSNANYNRSEYSESPIGQGMNNNQSGIDFGDLLCVTELKENELFDKLVHLKDYSTQTNKFDKHKADLILNFVDRDGIEIRSIAFGRLDTGNRLSLTDKIKELKGTVAWLQGRLITRSGRKFIDIVHIQQSNVDQALAREFFQREVLGKKEIVKSVWSEMASYPLSNAIYSAYEVMINTIPVKEVFERQGGYVYYLSYLLNAIRTSPINIKMKDRLLALDMIRQLKLYVNNVELAKSVQHFAISKYDDKVSEDLLGEALFNNNMETSVYSEILDGLRKGIITLVLLEDWSKWGLETVYSNYHRTLLRIDRSN